MDKRLVLTGQEGAGPGPYVVPAIELPWSRKWSVVDGDGVAESNRPRTSPGRRHEPRSGRNRSILAHLHDQRSPVAGMQGYSCLRLALAADGSQIIRSSSCCRVGALLATASSATSVFVARSAEAHRRSSGSILKGMHRGISNDDPVKQKPRRHGAGVSKAAWGLGRRGSAA
jgi:hypothetical protein